MPDEDKTFSGVENLVTSRAHTLLTQLLSRPQSYLYSAWLGTDEKCEARSKD